MVAAIAGNTMIWKPSRRRRPLTAIAVTKHRVCDAVFQKPTAGAAILNLVIGDRHADVGETHGCRRSAHPAHQRPPVRPRMGTSRGPGPWPVAWGAACSSSEATTPSSSTEGRRPRSRAARRARSARSARPGSVAPARVGCSCKKRHRGARFTRRLVKARTSSITDRRPHPRRGCSWARSSTKTGDRQT